MFRVRELMPGARTTEIKSERSLLFYLNSVQFKAGRIWCWDLVKEIRQKVPGVFHCRELLPDLVPEFIPG